MAQDRLILLLLNVDVHDKYTTAPPNPVSNDSAFCLLIHHFGNWHHGTGFSYPRDDELASEFLILLRAFFLKLDPRNCPNRSYVRCIIDSGPRQASVAESPVALPPVSLESRHAVSHALNFRHRMLRASTGQHAGPNMSLVRRHHAAPPDDPKTWSAFGTVHLRLPFLRQVEIKEVHKHAA